MTGAQALDQIMARLARTGDTTLRAQALIEMVQLQRVLEKGTFQPWFLFTDDTTTYSTAANTESVTLTIGTFIRLEEESGGVWWKDTTITTPDQWVEIKRKPFTFLKAEYEGEDASTPKYYDYIGTKLYFRPIPDAIYNLRVMGYAHDSAPTDAAATNLWLTHADQWLVSAVTAIMASTYLQNTDLGNTQSNLAEGHRKQVYRDTEARKHMGQDYQMGDD